MRTLASFFLAGALLFTNLGVARLSVADRLNTDSDLGFVMDHVEQLYYGKVTPQALLDGERTGLQKYLTFLHLSANIPRVNAGKDFSSAHVAAQRQLDQVRQKYGAKVDGKMLAYAAIKGLASGVNDRYTVFFTPEEYKAFNNGLAPPHFGGVGVVIQSDSATGYITAFDVVPNGPADKAGVQQDDLLVSIDGHDTKGMKIADASKLLRGNESTTVHLGLKRGAQSIATDVTRGNVRPTTVVKHLLPNGIAYLELYVFGENTAAEFKTALARLEAAGAKGYVIDVRDNGGGYVSAALDISSQFISSGALVSTETRGGHFMTYYGDNEAMAPKPVAVLANANSASASEITIGALQDSGVATIVGTKTFGKGVMQDLYPLPDGSAVKITVARYFTPKNHDINHIGIVPDLQVPENSNPAYGIPEKDAQLAAAIKLIQARIAKL
jgi:carboxyl-terminal processing protease